MSQEFFSRLSAIDPTHTASWARSFITIDLDWASDEVLADTIDLVERADVSATWFITHPTAIIKRLQENPKFELGIHPNFNFLLNGDTRLGNNIPEIISRLLDLIPEAKSIRSHSLTTSTPLLQAMPILGLTHEANMFIPYDSGMTLKPFRIWNGIVRAPHFFEDDLFLLSGSDFPMTDTGLPTAIEPKSDCGIRVYDFHPIHIYLNTENIDRYELSRPYHNDTAQLERFRNLGFGTRSLFSMILGRP